MVLEQLYLLKFWECLCRRSGHLSQDDHDFCIRVMPFPQTRLEVCCNLEHFVALTVLTASTFHMKIFHRSEITEISFHEKGFFKFGITKKLFKRWKNRTLDNLCTVAFLCKNSSFKILKLFCHRRRRQTLGRHSVRSSLSHIASDALLGLIISNVSISA